MKWIIGVAVAGLMALSGVPSAGAAPTGDPIGLSVAFVCAADGTQTATWTVQNLSGAVATFTSWQTTPDPSQPGANTIAGHGSIGIAHAVTPGTATEDAAVGVVYPSGRPAHRTLSADVPDCQPVTTTTSDNDSTTVTEGGSLDPTSTTAWSGAGSGTGAAQGSGDPSTSSSSSLASTGAPSAAFAAVGIGLLATGALLLAATRLRLRAVRR